MAEQTSLTPRAAWFWGFVCLIAGLIPILQIAGYVPIPPNAPFGIFIAVGLVFLGGGVAVILQYGLPATGTSWLAQTVQYVLSLVVTGAMTAIAAWIAFAPGERRFTFNLPFVPPQVGAILGRLLFGVGTVLMVGVFLLFAIAGARRIRTGKSE